MSVSMKNLIIAIVLMFFFGSSVFAQEPVAEQEGWYFDIIPYLWLTGLDGRLTINGNLTKVDASFSDIADYLDFGIMAHFEARNNNWGFLLSPMYVSLSNDATVDYPVGDGSTIPIDMKLKTKMTIFEFGGTWVLLKRPLAYPQKRWMWFEVLGGGRYMNLDSDLEAKGYGAIGGSESWVDPFVGLRVRSEVSDKVNLGFRADFGGFGAASDFAWQLNASFAYKLPHNMSIWAAYRVLDVDYKTGKEEEKFQYDIRMNGILLGFGFRF